MDLHDTSTDNDDYENELDISWIHEHEKENNIEQNILREPCEFVHVYFIYINKNNYIEKVLSEKQTLSVVENKRMITKERVLHIIQNKRHYENKKYKFMESLLYHIDLEPENIPHFVRGEHSISLSKEFQKVLPLFQEVVVPDSIFIFHSINRVYFLFKEIPEKNIPKVILKPILKKSEKTKKHLILPGGVGVLHPHNRTKKVNFDTAIADALQEEVIQNKTKKNHSEPSQDTA